MKTITLLLSVLCITAAAQETGARYLIITHDNFYNDIMPLATWKHKKGMRTKVVPLSQIGSSTTAIKNYVTNAYNTWPVRPEYLLLVGAPNYIPFPQIGGWYTDNYYTNVTGDIYNEILSGRLTVHSTTETQTVVNKILAYERDPNTTDSLWFKKACLIVNRDYDPDDSIYFSDAYHAAGLMTEAGFVEIDTLCDQYGHNASTVINRVNAGRSIVMYRGQGLNNWSYPFNVNPDQTQNGTKLPIVISTTCRTMGTGSSPATAERWFLTGTPTNPRGAAGYFATTTTGSGIAHLRSAVAKGFHDSLFLGSKKTFGHACEGGRIKVYTMYPYYYGENEYRGFTTIGDPEMNIWTDTPCSLIVTHPATVPIGTASFTVNVARASSATPVGKAIVCVISETDSTIYAVDTTNISGNASLTIHPQLIDDTLDVTVTGWNLQPYEGEIVTMQAGFYVNYYASLIDDTLGGNGDNLINPNEDINMPLWIQNLGIDTAFDVIGIISTSDSYTVMTDSIRSFGTILANQVCSTGTDGYKFSVALNAPDGHMIDFDLTCKDDDGSSWESNFSHRVYAPNIAFHEALISGGNGNNTLEPGETVDLVVSVRNNGSAALDSADAVLQSFSQHVTVIDSIGFFPMIGIASIGNNSNDPFIITADTSIAPGTIVEFRMIITATYFIDTIPFSLMINTGIEETEDLNTMTDEPLDIYPNPGRGTINIDLTGILVSGHENAIGIYNVSGHLVRQYTSLSTGQVLTWAGKDEQGRHLPEGVYFVKYTSEYLDKTYKVILLE